MPNAYIVLTLLAPKVLTYRDFIRKPSFNQLSMNELLTGGGALRWYFLNVAISFKCDLKLLYVITLVSVNFLRLR